MKKLFLGTVIISVLAFSSCGKDDDISNKSCETLEREVQAALTLYSQDATIENCKSYRALLQAQLDKDCLEGNGALIQKIINTLNCS